MPFPFLPFGAILAGLILGAALTCFVWVLMSIDRVASRAAASVVSGLVSGLRGWSADDVSTTAPARSGPVVASAEVEPAVAIPVTRVR